jgi:zinc transport system ATP-binding protein
MKNKVIEVKNLTFENVLNDISLNIFEGEFVAILGANGGGKSTFIKLLLGIYESSSGHIKLLNKNQIGYVPQNVTNIDIIFPATVDEIIKTAFAYRNSFFKKISIEENAYITYLMNQFDISNLKNKLIAELSGGQKQRVMIVRALANKPKLLILDEPNIGLDTISQEKFISCLKEINKKNKTTILFVTHHLEPLKNSITKIFTINQVLE